MTKKPIYLDCNATTPIDPVVEKAALCFLKEDFGNAGSRTHKYGNRAKKAVEQARKQVAHVIDCKREEVVFTSGATESNNLALLGLAKHGDETGKKHIVSTQIEHKAILEPLQHLAGQGFEITLVKPGTGGWVEPEAVYSAIRSDTLLVSVMHVNNETGVVQPISDIANILGDHPVYFHCDAAQGFGKEIDQLRNKRIDLISISGHKIYGVKGLGAIILRRRQLKMPPLSPLMFGGGQERGLRPGTLPVYAIVALGKAAELALREADKRTEICRSFKNKMMDTLAPLGFIIHGDPTRTLDHVVNLSFPELDAEAVMLALKDLVAISNGSACTSSSYEPSHVLKAMGISEEEIQGALRWSWCHMTKEPDWKAIVHVIKKFL